MKHWMSWKSWSKWLIRRIKIDDKIEKHKNKNEKLIDIKSKMRERKCRINLRKIKYRALIRLNITVEDERMIDSVNYDDNINPRDLSPC